MPPGGVGECARRDANSAHDSSAAARRGGGVIRVGAGGGVAGRALPALCYALVFWLRESVNSTGRPTPCASAAAYIDRDEMPVETTRQNSNDLAREAVGCKRLLGSGIAKLPRLA